MKRKCINKRRKQILGSGKHLDYLWSFHKKYVLVPADKAFNNIIVVCKKHYIEVMIDKLTKGDVINQSTYIDVAMNN